MPPANVAFASALDLGAALPIDNTQTDINDAGLNFTVFYKFTCPVGLKMVWAWATSDQVSGYMPKTVPYDQAQVEILQESTDAPLPNNPIQFPVTPGQVHYIQVVTNANSVGPEHVDLQLRAAPDTTLIPNGAIVVNGDIINQPCGIFSGTANYETVKWIKSIAFGEGGDITPAGLVLFENRNAADKFIALYSGDALTELGRDSTMLAFSWIRYNRTTGKFWIMVLENAGFAKLYRLPPVVPLVKTLVATLTGAGNGRGISTNNAETIAYYYDNYSINGRPVRRWNLTTDVAMSDLAAGPGGLFSFLDSLVLEDDTILVGWSNGVTPSGTVRVVHYSTAGAILNTYDFTSFEEGNYGTARLAYAIDSPTHFWVKLRETDGVIATGDALFKKVRVLDGVVITTVNHLEYNERNYIGPAAASYRGQTGIWNSCPFVVYPVGTTSPSGLYKIVPNKRNDADVAIPSPIWKTALIP